MPIGQTNDQINARFYELKFVKFISRRAVRGMAALISLIFVASVNGQNDLRLLTMDSPIEREIARGEMQSYRLEVSRGEYVRVVIEQRGIDLALSLASPNGGPLADAVVAGGAFNVKELSLVVEADGDYRLIVRATIPTGVRGSYRIRISERRSATALDLSRVAAERLLAEAEALAGQGRADATRGAITKYEAALARWRDTGERQPQALTLLRIGNAHHNLGDPRRAIDIYAQPLAIWRELSDPQGTAAALSSLGWSCQAAGRLEEALAYYNQALPLRRQFGTKRALAQTLSSLGIVYLALGEPQRALEHYEEAIPLAQADGDQRQEAFALKNLGWIFINNGDSRRALEYAEQALGFWSRLGDRLGEADTFTLSGRAWSYQGESGKALDFYRQALSVWKETGNRYGEGQALNNIGAQYHIIKEFDLAGDYYTQALAIWQAIGNRYEEAKVYNNLGLLSREAQEVKKANGYFEQALELYRRLGDQRGQANTLVNLGFYRLDQANRAGAFEYFEQALKLLGGTDDQFDRAVLLIGLGRAHAGNGNKQEAQRYFSQALELSRRQSYPRIELLALYEMAQAAQGSNNLSEAQNLFAEAVKVKEAWLTRLSQRRLAAAAERDSFELYSDYADLLIQMHRLQPEKGYAAQAFELSERGRARQLLDLLNEARADPRQGAPIELLDRERLLRWQIGAKDNRRQQLLGSQDNKAQVARVEQELRDLIAQYREIQAKIRERSPGYAALTRPNPLSVAEIQKLLDEDTLLLEYLLGKNGSKLWVVGPNSITYFDLPKQDEIQSSARRVYELLKSARPSFKADETPQRRAQRLARIETEYQAASAELSRTLLGPVAGELGKKRLIIVPDGALYYLPFGALPAPLPKEANPAAGQVDRAPQQPRPLIVDHEVVPVPSCTVLTVLRQKQQGRSPAAKSVAVLADPVFSLQDSRLVAGIEDGGTMRQKNASVKGLTAHSTAKAPSKYSALERSAEEVGLKGFQRLKFSREEAEAIADLTPPETRMVALDFAANLKTVNSRDLDQYRIVHFATHGLINTKNPELSGLVLSLFNEKGEAQEGFLRLYDVYNLKLNADLVVLSGCETALGKEVRGEGLIGMTCGFMYAGAPCVVASLWSVGDQTTAKLMKQFYQKIFGEGLRPAAALRAAQIAMWKEQPRAVPYAWAAFVLQGEWK